MQVPETIRICMQVCSKITHSSEIEMTRTYLYREKSKYKATVGDDVQYRTRNK